MERRHHIEVELTLLPTEHGGRAGPVYSSYRPQFYYAGLDCDAEHSYPGPGAIRPGETTTARLPFLRPEIHLGRIFEGMPFLIREGNRVVGYGRVTRLLSDSGER